MLDGATARVTLPGESSEKSRAPCSRPESEGVCPRLRAGQTAGTGPNDGHGWHGIRRGRGLFLHVRLYIFFPFAGEF